jgi:hypothetical protein
LKLIHFASKTYLLLNNEIKMEGRKKGKILQYRVIREHSNWRRKFMWMGATATCVFCGGMGLLWGISAAQSQIRENAFLQEQVSQLSNENVLLRIQLTDSELVMDTQNHTTVALRDELTALHKVKASLETELGFFRKIMVPGETDQGIHVEKMNVALSGDSTFVIEATLIQVAQRPRVVSGSISFEIQGSAAGETINVASADLGATPQTLKFRFRYFQEIEQTIELPAEFKPTSIKVAVVAKNTKPKETEFAWPA